MYAKIVIAFTMGLLGCTSANAQSSADSANAFAMDSAVLQLVETVEIPATATGPVRDVHVEQGALIDRGQVLASIDDRDALIKLEEAEIELDIITAQSESDVDIEFAKKSRLVAVADYERAQESNRSYAGVVSAREMDRLKLLVEQSEAELEKISFEKAVLQMQKKLKEAAVRKKRIDADRYTIQSPLAGQIVEISKRPGEWVHAADVMFKVVRLDRLRVEEYLPARVAVNGLTGASAIFQAESLLPGDDGVDQPNREVAGRVVFVSPNVDPLNSTVLVWIEFENPGLQLRPGMKGQVRISNEKKADVDGQPAADQR